MTKNIAKVSSRYNKREPTRQTGSRSVKSFPQPCGGRLWKTLDTSLAPVETCMTFYIEKIKIKNRTVRPALLPVASIVLDIYKLYKKTIFC